MGCVHRRDENVSSVFSLNNEKKKAHFHFGAIVLAFIISLKCMESILEVLKDSLGNFFMCAVPCKNIYFPKFLSSFLTVLFCLLRHFLVRWNELWEQ